MEQRINNWFATNAGQYTVKIASPNLMFAHIGQRNIKSMLTGVSLALILISILLLPGISFQYIVITGVSHMPVDWLTLF